MTRSLLVVACLVMAAESANALDADQGQVEGEKRSGGGPVASNGFNSEVVEAGGCTNEAIPLKKVPPVVGQRYRVSVRFDAGAREWRPVPFPRVPDRLGVRIVWQGLSAWGELDRTRNYTFVVLSAGERIIEGSDRRSAEYAFDVLRVCNDTG
jgi:hypothetical protein